jgi:hypothetical protein
MPAVKVYRHQGNLPGMIPVEQAKIVKAYQCPFTGTIVSTKKSYVKHLKTLRSDRMHRRARDLRHRRKLQDLWNQPDFESVVKWIQLNPETFWENGQKQGWNCDRAAWNRIRDSFIMEVCYLKLDYSESVSNTHSCPHNGVTNWSRRDTFADGTEKPTGYPGWQGTVRFHISHEVPGFFSNLLNGTRIHTGAGGGHDNLTYEYEVKLFLADWPGIALRIAQEKEEYERKHLVDMIKNQYQPYRVASFCHGKR